MAKIAAICVSDFKIPDSEYCHGVVEAVNDFGFRTTGASTRCLSANQVLLAALSALSSSKYKKSPRRDLTIRVVIND
ncbi:hypothetical protein GCM10026988_27540 [Vibrio panuliri]